MTVGPSQVVLHAPKPIRPAFSSTTRAQLHRRRSSASQGSTSPATATTGAGLWTEDVADELWTILKPNTSPSSAAFHSPWRPSNMPRACSRNGSHNTVQERSSPRCTATPPPRTGLFNPIKFQPTSNFWAAPDTSDWSAAALQSDQAGNDGIRPWAPAQSQEPEGKPSESTQQ